MNNYLIVALVAAAVGAFGGGMLVKHQDGLSYGRQIADLNARHTAIMKGVSDAAAKQVGEAMAKLRAQQEANTALDTKYTKELNDAKLENQRLRADVDRGSKRLRIAAVPSCGQPVPQAPGASRVDDGTVDLAPSARSAYFDLRQALIDDQKKIAALQDYARSVCQR